MRGCGAESESGTSSRSPNLAFGLFGGWLQEYSFWVKRGLFFLAVVCALVARGEVTVREDGYHVFVGDRIQEAVERAATNRVVKRVVVHAGVYRPESRRQALVWFNKKHSGVELVAEGEVTLTAENRELGKEGEVGFPAVVNHVVYFGDGVGTNTLIRGFRIVGANGFITKERTRQMEPDISVPKNLFFFSDGGAIKVFGRSYPRIQNVEVVENFASPCAGGISVQHQGHTQESVLIENCVFMRNRAQATGCAIDLLEGSAARIVNCLFVGNVSNTGDDPVAKASGEKPFVNSGVITIFQRSFAEVRNCTFTGNRNGIDDMGGGSVYVGNIFYENTLEGPANKGLERFDLALAGAREVSGNFFSGGLLDLKKVISAERNVMKASAPDFDKEYAPRNAVYKDAGYRPTR